jgi:hypothetical protein
MKIRRQTAMEEILFRPPSRMDEPVRRLIAGERYEWVTNPKDGAGMWYCWRRITTAAPRAARSPVKTTVERARPRERRSTRRATAKSRGGPDDLPGDRPSDGSPQPVGRVADSGHRLTLRDVSYRLNVAQVWHNDGADEDAWAVINSLREEVDRDLRDERRAA